MFKMVKNFRLKFDKNWDYKLFILKQIKYTEVKSFC